MNMLIVPPEWLAQNATKAQKKVVEALKELLLEEEGRVKFKDLPDGAFFTYIHDGSHLFQKIKDPDKGRHTAIITRSTVGNNTGLLQFFGDNETVKRGSL